MRVIKQSLIISLNNAFQNEDLKKEQEITLFLFSEHILIIKSNLKYCLKFFLYKVFSSIQIFEFLEKLVGFGNLRLRRSKVTPQPD